MQGPDDNVYISNHMVSEFYVIYIVAMRCFYAFHCCLSVGEVYVPVLWQAPVIEGQGSFPVIIFTHGLGGNRTTYSTMCTDLASQGFIVAAIEHRYQTQPHCTYFPKVHCNFVKMYLKAHIEFGNGI